MCVFHNGWIFGNINIYIYFFTMLIILIRNAVFLLFDITPKWIFLKEEDEKKCTSFIWENRCVYFFYICVA